jgi:hypothetical protein
MDKELAIQEILNDLEHQPLQKSRTFQAYLNQPELISLSSTNAQPQSAPISSQTDNSYYNFIVNLPRPAISSKSVQLLKAIIPQAQTSIPDYSLVFPYYKIRTVPISENDVYYVEAPSFENLFFIRLLPSYYKRELFPFANFYGYNKTFNDYIELSQELKKACTYDPTFDEYSHYLSDDIIIDYNEKENKFAFLPQNIGTEPNPPNFGIWEYSSYYEKGVIIQYEKKFYKAKDTIDFSVNPPPDDPELWFYVSGQTLNTYPNWTIEDTYVVNDIVFDENDEMVGAFFICLEPNTSSKPWYEPTFWKNISQYFQGDLPFFNTYLIAGYNDVNVQTLLQYVRDKSSTTYDAQRQEIINGDFNWSSIPGNPYVQSQTLARRLGFTWDSTGMITDTINNYITTGITYGSSTALFYNRLRPIPPYSPAVVNNFFTLKVDYRRDYYYSADGYCNLVYSSIINIYTTIIGTSSVDTQRNANLLGTVEMNCANLGITMANNFIDTKLTKIQCDIYSIYIELRDENGVEYYLTNNATTTLLLKLSYD